MIKNQEIQELKSQINLLQKKSKKIEKRLNGIEAATESTKMLYSDQPLTEKIYQSLVIVLRHMKARRGSIMLVDLNNNEELVVIEAVLDGERNNHLVGKRQKIGSGISGFVLENHNPLLIKDITNDPIFSKMEKRDKYDTGSFISTPLLQEGGNVIGVLSLTDKRSKRGFFNQSDLEILTFFAEKISPVIRFGQLHEEVKKKNDALVSLQKMQEDLTYMIVHDLKGPLGEIISNLDILTYSKTINQGEREVLNTAIQGCDTLLPMIMNLLDISKMEEGKLTLHYEELSIRDLIVEKLKKSQVIANEKELSIVSHFSESTPLVRADRQLLERIITNLLNNAISYSVPKGTIEISILSEDSFVKITVRDEGKGIPEIYQKDIFKKFGQGAETGNRRRGSTGLGLTFCKLAVETHNGKIWVESIEGEGSKFIFTLPVAGI